MKKLKFIALFALGLSLFSCEDAYNITQDGEFGEAETFQSVGDMQSWLNEVYDKATISGEIGYSSLLTDETSIGSQNAGQDLETYKFIINNQDGNADAIWANDYALINYANRLLRGAARVTPTADQQADYNNIIAQAKLWRAWGHFQLLAAFSENIKDDSSLGVILMDRVPTLDEQLPRNTTGEVFALIESDLAAAAPNLIEPTGAEAYKYLSSNFINAFRARMYAYRGNYALAEQYADAAIAAGPALTAAGTYTNNTTFYNPTTTTSPYRKMWADGAQGEIIFALARPVGKEAIAGLWYFNQTKISGGPFHDMGRKLMNLLADQDQDGSIVNVLNNPVGTQTNPGDHDVRSRAFLDPTSLIASNPDAVPAGTWKSADVPCIDKYPGKSGADLTNDLKVFRTSEMYLIKAEARVAAGDLTTAATILKQIRDARTFSTASQPALPQPLPVYADATAAWKDILLERRKELCFEGHRFYDLRRLGALAGGETIDRYYRDCDDFQVPICSLSLTDYRMKYLPIPLAEFLGNGNIQQNEGF
ncbi:MAG: RagB/SusD family nutrient uptake outer membrane protein [Flavobacterium sp.]|nr:MAG: RagB/SusD family nutrient uptake outer membrane protein [Flavobacterium sp.]